MKHVKYGNVIAEVIIPKFIDRVLLSKKRKVIYYKKEDSHPKRMNNPKKYGVDSDGYIIDKNNGAKLIKNFRTAGKEKWIKISGQDLWSGINHNLRSKIAKEIKRYFYAQLRDVKPLDESAYPIGIGIEIYDVNDDGDIDNMEHIYRKCIHDVLAGNIEFSKNQEGKWVVMKNDTPPIIVDDNKGYVREMRTRFHIIDDHEKRKMKIIIYSIR